MGLLPAKKTRRNSTTTKQSPVTKWPKNTSRDLSNDEIQKASRHMRKKFSGSIVMRETKIKITMGFHFTPGKMAINKESEKQ